MKTTFRTRTAMNCFIAANRHRYSISEIPAKTGFRIEVKEKNMNCKTQDT